MSQITFETKIDFDGDGTAETDLRPYINQDSDVVIDRGVGPDGKPNVSQVTLSLNNIAGAFSLGNTSATYYGMLKRGCVVRLRTTHLATLRSWWLGVVWNFQFVGEGQNQRVVIVCRDRLATLVETKNALFTASASRATDDALQAILTACGYSAADWTMTNTTDTLQLHMPTGKDALQQCLDVAKANFGGTFYAQNDGDFRFRGVDDMDHGTPDDTWGYGSSVIPSSILPELRWDDQKSRVECSYTRFVTGTAAAITVFVKAQNAQNGNSVKVPASASITFEAAYSLPVYALTAPVATTHYLGNDNADGSGTNRTSSLTVTATDHGDKAVVKVDNALGSDVYLTMLTLAADVKLYVHPTGAATGDSELIAAGATLTFDAPYLSLAATTLTAMVSGTDYKGNLAADGSSTDETANLDVTATDYGILARVAVKNNHSAGVYLTRCWMRGAAVQIEKGRNAGAALALATALVPGSSRQQVTERAGQGVLSYELAVTGLPGSPTEQIQQLYRDNRAPLPMSTYGRLRALRHLKIDMTVVIDWDVDAHITACLKADLYDLIRLTDNDVTKLTAWLTGVDDWYRIVGIKHQYTPGGSNPGRTTFRLTPSYMWPWSVAFLDTFDGTAPAALAKASPNGETWNVVTKFGLDGAGKATTTATGRQAAVIIVAWNTAVAAEIGVSVSAVTGTRRAGLAYRCANGTDEYFALYLDGVGNLLTLEKRVGGVTTVLVSVGLAHQTSGELMVRVRDNIHQIFLDGVYMGVVTDSALAASGNVGLFTNSTSTAALYDDLYMRNL